MACLHQWAIDFCTASACTLAVEIGESKLDEEDSMEIDDMISACAWLVTVDKD